MKAIVEIEDGRLTLPKEIFEKNNLPAKGKYEVELKDRKIQLSPPIEPPWNMIKLLQESRPPISIDAMVKAEVPDVD